ncbi:hypothetical protein JHK82_034007 [Glycine max]|nr:hypothetical protein JHK82_034007 [Glycine max]
MGVPAAANLYYSSMNPSSGAAVSLNAEVMRGNYQYFNASASSSVAPPNARHTENGIPSLPHCTSWSRSGESMMVRDPNRITRVNYLSQHFQPAAPPPWLDQQLNSNNNDGHALPWHQSLLMPYVQAPSANGSSLENARMGPQRYHDTAGSRSGHRFPHPPLVNPHYHSFHHQTQPVQEMRGHSINFHPPPPVTAPSYRVPTNPSRSSSIFIQDSIEMGARHVGAAPFAGFIGKVIVVTLCCGGCKKCHCGHLACRASCVTDWDVTLLVDHHNDMRLDIEDMSYEASIHVGKQELLALGERIGKVNTGLSEEMITSQMKTKTYLLLPTNAINLEEAASEEQENDSCIICQDEYKSQEKIGILQCGHEYHADCLKKWLLVKNVCPICKSEALTPGEKCV